MASSSTASDALPNPSSDMAWWVKGTPAAQEKEENKKKK
jgi:hypothetical protein